MKSDVTKIDCNFFNKHPNERIRIEKYNSLRIINLDGLEIQKKALAIISNKQLSIITTKENNYLGIYYLILGGNDKLISMSIPKILIERLKKGMEDFYINNLTKSELKNGWVNRMFYSPEEFINHPMIIADLVIKFNPGYHGDQVVKQIIENVEEWGTEETKEKVYSHLISNGVKHLIPQHILNRFDTDAIKNNNKIIMDFINGY